MHFARQYDRNPVYFAILAKLAIICDKKVFDKTIAALDHGSGFVIFNFLENNDFFWNSVESSDFVNSVT